MSSTARLQELPKCGREVDSVPHLYHGPGFQLRQDFIVEPPPQSGEVNLDIFSTSSIASSCVVAHDLIIKRDKRDNRRNER